MSGSNLISKFKSGRDSSNPTVSLVRKRADFYDLVCKPGRNFSGGFRVDFQSREICICVGRKVARKYAGTEQLYTVHHGYCSFRYQVVSTQVDSVEV